ncbi:hypothetical protein AVEN_216591-1 [Araneus ventricosus]|uniref:Uncharacterized protein n=1 Tax=Araneus ventricosus TaxID=182803 RepID=A0A4Y2X0L1_ARAVE|nr:hypothetical protein AVEN_216591-1 [Araneus ventricosus]
MNLLGTTMNQFWVRISDNRRKYSDIMIENTTHTEVKDSFTRIASATSSQSVTHQHTNAFQFNYEGNFIPVSSVDPYLQDTRPEEMDYISNSLDKTGVAPLPLKEDSLKNESTNKSLCSSHRITSSVQMKNHPLRKSTSGFESESSKARSDKATISQQDSSRMSLKNSQKQGVKSKKTTEVKFKLDSCENILDIESNCKETTFSANINDLKSGDFDIEALDNKNVFPTKLGAEGETIEGKDNFPPHNKMYPVSSETEDYHSDVTSYLEDTIRKINKISKGKKILNLINGELVLSDRIPTSSNQYDEIDDTWIKFISEGNITNSGIGRLEDVHNSSKFISEVGTPTFGIRKIHGHISQKGIFSHGLENAETKKDELFSRCGLNRLVKENDIKFQDKAIQQIEPVSPNKTYDTMTTSEANIASSDVDLMTLNINNYDLYGNSDLFQWKENSDTLMSDVKSRSSKSSISSNVNCQVKEDRQYDDTVKHMIMGCCPECKTNPYSYKYVVYNIPEEENNKRNLFEKNIGECLLKHENAFLRSPERKTEKVGKVFVSNPLNRKPPCSETDRQDHFSSGSDSLAYGLHKNVFKKFNPRSLLMFQTPASRNRFRPWEGDKNVDKSSKVLLENGSREFLKKSNAKEILKETHDDENPLISHENKSSETLISNSVFKYSNLSSSLEWQSFFERTFKTGSSNSCGTEDCRELMGHTQLKNVPKNLPSKLAALGRNGESFLHYWTNNRKKTDAKKSLCNKIKTA